VLTASTANGADGSGANGTRHDSLCQTPPTSTLTFLFTDIEGSTEKLTRLGDAYASILREHHRIIRDAIGCHEGREVDTAGDGFFAVFQSPRSAIAAVIEMQRGLGMQVWSADERVRVRMGLHVGEATVTTTGLVGLDVHKAARIAAVAHGSQVVVSEACAILVRDRLDDDVSLRSLGSHRLKDLSRPEEIFQLEAEGLESDFPPLKSLDNPLLKHNLPLQLTSFVGREHDVSELAAATQGHRLVTITGPGGCGKTRLALQVGAELLSGDGDGVWFVDLSPVREDSDVARTLAAVFNVVDQPPVPLVESVGRSIGAASMLIVVDNCEHVVDGCAKTLDFLLRHCPRLHVIATSREPLDIESETIVRVPPMSVPENADPDANTAMSYDAIRLFSERVRAFDPDFQVDSTNLATVLSLCRRLDGIPLAIELAAARTRTMTVEDVERRLDERFRLLRGGSRTVIERQRTLEALIGWSYDLLAEPEQIALKRLSVFVGSFDLEAADAVAGRGALDAFDVADVVGSLADRSLLQLDAVHGSTRYRFLETVRDYARRRLVESDEGVEPARDDHAAYFERMRGAHNLLLPTQEELARDRASWPLERADVLAAMQFRFEAGRVDDSTIRLVASSIESLNDGGNYQLRDELTTMALDQMPPGADPLLRSILLRQRSTARNLLGRAVDAKHDARDAVELARERDPVVLGRALWTLLLAARRSDDDETLRYVYDAATAVLDARPSEMACAYAHRVRAQIPELGSPEQRRADADSALEYFAHDARWIPAVRHERWWLEVELGDYARARELMLENFDVAKLDVARSRHVFVVHVNHSMLESLVGNAPEAARAWEMAVAAGREVDVPALQTTALFAAGLALSAGGFDAEAVLLHGASLALTEQQGAGLERTERQLRSEDLSRLRDRLGPARVEQLLVDGSAIDFGEARSIAERCFQELAVSPPNDQG
jgi:predicted ATPase/class 3 adenylate cyclase